MKSANLKLISIVTSTLIFIISARANVDVIKDEQNITKLNSSAKFDIAKPTITSPINGAEDVGRFENGELAIKVDINWTHSGLNDITNTTIYYKKSDDNSYNYDVSVSNDALTYTLEELSPYTQYSVIISETNASSNGEINSTVTSFTTKHNPPYNISASSATNSIALSWSDGNLSHNQYRIYQDGVKIADNIKSNTYTITDLSPSKTYKFIISEYTPINHKKKSNLGYVEFNSTEVNFTTLTEQVIQTALTIPANIKITQDESNITESNNTIVNS